MYKKPGYYTFYYLKAKRADYANIANIIAVYNRSYSITIETLKEITTTIPTAAVNNISRAFNNEKLDRLRRVTDNYKTIDLESEN